MGKGEIVEEIQMSGTSYFQCQSRAGQAFLDLGWRIEPVAGTAIVANVPSKTVKDELDGKVSVELNEGKCYLRYVLKKPPMFGAEKAAMKLLKAPFDKVFSQKQPAEGTDDAAKHSEEMLALMIEQERRAEERKANALAKKRKLEIIKLCILLGLDLLAIGVGAAMFGGLTAGLITAGICHCVVWVICKIVWPIFWAGLEYA